MARNLKRIIYRRCRLFTANNGTPCINLSYKKYVYLNTYIQRIIVFWL